MNNKIITLVLGIIAVINVIYSFWHNPASERILGFDINTWLYRLIWAVFAALFISDYINKSKKEKK